MRSRYKIADLEAPHFITSTVVGRLPVFTRQKYPDIITDSLNSCRHEKGLLLHAYVIPDNHLHMMVSSDNKPSKVIRDFKKIHRETNHCRRSVGKYIVASSAVSNAGILMNNKGAPLFALVLGVSSPSMAAQKAALRIANHLVKDLNQ